MNNEKWTTTVCMWRDFYAQNFQKESHDIWF